jgi:hypothetical protein
MRWKWTSNGAAIEGVCRKLEISEQTFHRRRYLYGGKKGPEMGEKSWKGERAVEENRGEAPVRGVAYTEQNACRLVKQSRETQHPGLGFRRLTRLSI